ncbi:Invasin IpaC [Pandoraea horticolens]|uniref:Effector protein BipC n=1 Tax=Pandoraea horticolens TaxID=2508298 RepID=A0A5E4XKY7_9BURK|nr:IpaC/SipC family type III secretion system effector [Pandoraea horticolens]VVE36798.1 Invasin IpaC [Pandoraea horticolens]
MVEIGSIASQRILSDPSQSGGPRAEQSRDPAVGWETSRLNPSDTKKDDLALVGFVVSTMRTRNTSVEGASGKDELLRQAMSAEKSGDPDLKPPTVSADTQKVAREVAHGVAKMQEKQKELSQNPSVATSVDMLLNQFGSASSRPDVSQRQAEAARVDDVAAERGAGNASAGGTFGSGVQDEMFNVLLKIAAELRKAQKSELAMQSKMVTIQRQAAMSQASSLERQGQDMLGGAISGGVLLGALSVAGGAMQMKGLNTRADSIQTELKPQAELRKFDAEQQFAMRGRNGPTLAETESPRIDLNRPNGETVRLSAAPGGDRLSEEHTSVLSEERATRQYRIDMHDINHKQNEIIGTKQQNVGSAVSTSAMIAKNQAEGISSMAQSNERAQQALEQNNEQTSSSTANGDHENAQKIHEMMQKMHDLAMQVNTANGGVASQVASNLRA